MNVPYVTWSLTRQYPGRVPLKSLGMPAMPPRSHAPAWKQAWDDALYGPHGFFRREAPAEHFRTSVHASPLLAEALLELCHDTGLRTVVDLGSGRGELLRQLHKLDPSLRLLGVEVAARPVDLPDAIGWSATAPRSVEGLVFANEWLDNVPCHVAEVDEDGETRIVHVDKDGTESLGSSIDDPTVPGSLARWRDRWWPVVDPGARIEIGTTRDRAWADVLPRITRGMAIAVDYGHTFDGRPRLGSLRSYKHGIEVDVAPDGTRDITADVAVDAVAAACNGLVIRQSAALSLLGISGTRPPLDDATTDPAGYLHALSGASEAAELTAAGALGDFHWIITPVGVESVLA